MLSNIWDRITGALHFLYGGAVDSGWGVAASIYVTVVAIAFGIAGYRSLREFLKGFDVGFSEKTLDTYNLNRPAGTPERVVNWRKALIQRVRPFRFTLPYGALVLVSLVWFVRDSFTLYTYFVIAAGYLLFAPVLRVWWIATAVWTDKRLVKRGKDPVHGGRSLHDKSVRWAVRHYMNWGLQKSTVKRPPFIGWLRPLNPVIKLFGLRWLQVRLLRPLFVCAFYAFLWPLSAVIAVFHLNKELDDRNPALKPEWAAGYAMEPTYDTGAIPDSPGDAAAAATA